MLDFRPTGIVSVVQTPFTLDDQVDEDSLGRLVEDAIGAGVNGFLAPAVASEVSLLRDGERLAIMQLIARLADGRVPLIAGASAEEPERCAYFARQAEQAGATAYLVAVPASLYGQPERVLWFFETVAAASDLPLVIQDLQWNGPGLDLPTVARLAERLPTLAGFKIETVPAGPKYTAVRALLGPDALICGGWAIPQMIEALDRGVDAMVPESAMVKVYASVYHSYTGGDRDGATALFRQLLPILTFTNQEIWTSIAFFKRLLVRRGIFSHAGMRQRDFAWDAHALRIADELIDLYLALHLATPSISRG